MPRSLTATEHDNIITNYQSELYDRDTICMKLVRRAIRRGIDIRRIPPDGVTPMMLAAYQGDRKLMQFLYDNGVSIHAVDYTGSNAAIYAATGNSVLAVSLLAQWGCDLNAPNILGATAARMFKEIDIRS